MRERLRATPINEYSDVGNKLTWTIYAENAEPKTGEIAFKEMKQF